MDDPDASIQLVREDTCKEPEVDLGESTQRRQSTTAADVPDAQSLLQTILQSQAAHEEAIHESQIDHEERVIKLLENQTAHLEGMIMPLLYKQARRSKANTSNNDSRHSHREEAHMTPLMMQHQASRSSGMRFSIGQKPKGPKQSFMHQDSETPAPKMSFKHQDSETPAPKMSFFGQSVQAGSARPSSSTKSETTASQKASRKTDTAIEETDDEVPVRNSTSPAPPDAESSLDTGKAVDSGKASKKGVKLQVVAIQSDASNADDKGGTSDTYNIPSSTFVKSGTAQSNFSKSGTDKTGTESVSASVTASATSGTSSGTASQKAKRRQTRFGNDETAEFDADVSHALKSSSPLGDESDNTRRKTQLRNVDEVMDALKNQEQSRAKAEKKKSTVAQTLEEEEWSLKGMIQLLLDQKEFDYAVALVIVLNAVYIGVHADWSVKNMGQSEPQTFVIMEYCFTCVFLLELLLRLVAYRLEFYSCQNRSLAWNVFDTFIVLSSLFEVAFQFLNTSTPNMSAIRLLRILRLIRVVRIIRVLRFFRELRLMVFGIMSSMKSLVWCLLLLVLIMFMFGVVVLQITTQHLEEAQLQGEVNEELRDSLLFNFGSLLRAIYTLMMCISSGVSWGLVAEPLVQVSGVFALLFTIYIAFSVFCVLNIVTGVFVENSHKLALQDEDHAIMEELGQRRRFMEEIRNLFEDADEDGDGELDFDEFFDKVTDTRMQTYFRKLGLDVELVSPWALFQLFDFGDDGSVDVDEFVQGCCSLGGLAKQLDLVRMRHENKRLTETVECMTDRIISKLELMNKATEEQGRGGRHRGAAPMGDENKQTLFAALGVLNEGEGSGFESNRSSMVSTGSRGSYRKPGGSNRKIANNKVALYSQIAPSPQFHEV